MSEELKTEAAQVLDLFLFEDIFNNNNHSEDEWGISYEGDNYVLLHYETGKLFHYRVTIEEHKWDSTKAIKDQEWHLDYDLEGFDD